MAPRRRTDLRVALLAGWLFADLLAFLFVVELSTAPPVAKPSAAGSATASPLPSPSPAATPSSYPFGLDPKSATVTLNDVDYGAFESGGTTGSVAQDLAKQVSQQLAAQPGGGRPVGLILTLADAPEADLGDAVDVANLIDSTLTAQQQYAHAITHGGWQGASDEDTITLTVYFDNEP